jgi:hypothetical protein
MYVMRYIISDYSKWNQSVHLVGTQLQNPTFIGTDSEFDYMFYLSDEGCPEETN